MAISTLVALLALGAGPISSSSTDGYGEYEIKAAFLMNFVRYTEWPGEERDEDEIDTTPVVIGVLGADPFGQDLRALEDKSVGDRPIIVRLYQRLDDIDCHVLYVSSSERRRLPELLSVLASRPVFTVSDLPGFAEDGGICRFVRVGDNIRFEINNGSAKRAGLRLSSHLLRLAISVEGEA